MRALSFPLQRVNGQLRTHDPRSNQAAAERAGHVIACGQGERPLAPTFGLPDPSMDGIHPAVIAGAITHCDPDVAVADVRLADLGAGRIRVEVDVRWRTL